MTLKNVKPIYIGKSNYKNVYIVQVGGVTAFKATVSRDGQRWQKICEGEREAAIAVDTKLISWGKSPVNILKPKF